MATVLWRGQEAGECSADIGLIARRLAQLDNDNVLVPRTSVRKLMILLDHAKMVFVDRAVNAERTDDDRGSATNLRSMAADCQLIIDELTTLSGP